MARRIGKYHWLALAGLALLGLLAWAWIDGGERALAPVSEEVILPEIRS